MTSQPPQTPASIGSSTENVDMPIRILANEQGDHLELRFSQCNTVERLIASAQRAARLSDPKKLAQAIKGRFSWLPNKGDLCILRDDEEGLFFDALREKIEGAAGKKECVVEVRCM